jgi:organic radical activating enzyme
VSEIFGPTWQGEGPSAGQLAAFLRLGRCNLTCSWCDTAYTWDPSRYDLRAELHRKTPGEVWHALQGIDAGLVVITGGEPLLQQHRLTWLTDMCRASNRRVEIETNGTIAPRPSLIHPNVRFNVSVKLAHSGVPEARRIRPWAIQTLARTGTARWKFVVRDSTDLDEIAGLEEAFTLAPIWVMCEGTKATTVLGRMQAIADDVLQRGWNLTPRLHTLLWGDARGR